MGNSIIEQVEARKTALKPEDLAKLFTVSKRTIYEWVERGKLPVMRLGSSLRFDPKTTAAWLRERAM